MTYKRPSFDDTLMAVALEFAKRTTCPRARKLCPQGIGAIVVERATHRVLGAGYCGAKSGTVHCDEAGCLIGPGSGCVRTVHAEVNAFDGLRYFEGSKTLYTTVSPCEACMLRAILENVTRVVYKHAYRILAPTKKLAAEHGIALVRFVSDEEREQRLADARETRFQVEQADALELEYELYRETRGLVR